MVESPPTRPLPWRNSDAKLDGLHRIISAANSTRPLDVSLQTVAETVADVMDTDVCSIFLFDREQGRLYLRATKGLNRDAIGEMSMALGQGIGGTAAQWGEPIIVPDVRMDQRFYVDPQLNEHRYGSMVSVPIILFLRREGDFAGDQLLGVISVQSIAHRDFSEEEVHFLELVAGELAFFISNAQRYQATDEQLNQKIRELTTLQKVSAAITSTLDHQTVLNLIVEQAVTLPQVERADIFESDATGERITMLASHGGQWDERLRPVVMRAIADGRAVVVVSGYEDGRFPELAEVASRDGYHALFCIPLRIHARTIGAIALYTRELRSFGYEEIQLLVTFADFAAIAIENARLFQEVQRSLDIKTAMLREMDHRVNNNLGTMKALLNLQRLQVKEESPAGAAALAESADQIEAMRAVHDVLRGKHIEITTIREVAEQLIKHKPRRVGNGPVHFEALGGDFPIRAPEATLVALVLNEFIDNALGHGLAAEGGTIEVEAWLDGSEVVLEVRDDGPRRPAGPARQSTGQGHSIIEKLVIEGHKGSFHFSRDQAWSRARIRFPYEASISE